jgi:O-antigen ligase
MVAERPFLGYGGGSFQQAFQLFREPSLPPRIVWQQAHSTYLSLWVGHGLIAGSIPLVIVGVVVAQLSRMFIRSRRSYSAESSAALGATAVVGLHSSVDFSLEIQAVAMIYIWLLAIAYSRCLEITAKPRLPSNSHIEAQAETPPVLWRQ